MVGYEWLNTTAWFPVRDDICGAVWVVWVRWSTEVYTDPDYYCLNVIRSIPPRVGVGVPILSTLPTGSSLAYFPAHVVASALSV